MSEFTKKAARGYKNRLLAAGFTMPPNLRRLLRSIPGTVRLRIGLSKGIQLDIYSEEKQIIGENVVAYRQKKDCDTG